MSTKEEVIEMIKKMPDNASTDDIMEKLFEKIKREIKSARFHAQSARISSKTARISPETERFYAKSARFHATHTQAGIISKAATIGYNENR
ncbi:hypothetical protein [Natribacillus halophilus]|uniref:Uncharacterized protein n=1 Tax=Natribacillus halophilus TaxID=549003 RepID=A0A1G8Q1F4_9BACI|nr:hypothetical protein [Natribacillus halophilus]SDI98527.1 hypothetical protein SAMN04488123_11057 [Natribacillus halophilus]